MEIFERNCTAVFQAVEGDADPARALAIAYCRAFVSLFVVIKGACNVGIRLVGAECDLPEYCHLGWLADCLRGTRRQIGRAAASAAKRAAAHGAPVPLAALAAGIEGADAAIQEMTACHTLISEIARLQGEGETCVPLYGWVTHCAMAFEEAAVSVQKKMTRLRRTAYQVQAGSWIQWPHLSSGFAFKPAAVLSEIIQLERLMVPSGGLPTTLLMAELGVRSAETSEALLETFPSLRMLLVDPYDLNGDKKSSELTSERVRHAALARTAPFRHRARHILEMSNVAASGVNDSTLDIVFVDADHRYANCIEDILLWWPKLRPGGVLAGHDYHVAFPGVVQAVNEFAVETGLHLKLSSGVWWFVRPRPTP